MILATYLVYFSPTKSTEKIVKIIGKEFGETQEIDLCNKENDFKKSFHQDDICIVGVPSYGGRVPAIALERIKNFKGNHAKAILVVSYGNRDYDDTLIELADCLKEVGFLCVGAISAIAEHSIMHQFATGRPDSKDEIELSEFAKKILKKIKSNSHFTDLHLPGNHPYKTYNGLPLKPKASKVCTACGLCANVCPVGAISVSNPAKTNKSLCISCMRCVEVCPVHARKVNSLLVKVAAKKMKKSCETRKENELFI